MKDQEMMEKLEGRLEAIEKRLNALSEAIQELGATIPYDAADENLLAYVEYWDDDLTWD